MKLRPFTKDDWNAFAGCRSEEPKIGEIIIAEVDKNLKRLIHHDAIVIVDGNEITIQVFKYSTHKENNDFGCSYYSKEFENEFVAEIFANGMKTEYLKSVLTNLLKFKLYQF